jgi:hypothetical protein
MTRFQLVFRQDGREQIETHDSTGDGDPQINGTIIVDGEKYVIRGVEWLVTREDIGDTKRFVCTLVAELSDIA